MSETTNTLKQSSVTGGKVWTPPVTATSTSKQKVWQDKLLDVTLRVAVAIFSLNIVFLFLHMPISPLDSVPEHIPYNTFNGFGKMEWLEIVLFATSLVLTILMLVCLKNSDKTTRIIILLVGVILLLPASFNVITKLHNQQIHQWGKQYGYSFSSFIISDMFGNPDTVNAYNLKTEQWEELPIDIVDGNMVLVGVEKISEDTTEDIPTLEVIVENGTQYLVDKTTGKKSEITAYSDDGTLEFKDEKETNNE